MTIGFQSIIVRHKNGTVKEVRYHGPRGVCTITFNRRYGTWTFDQPDYKRPVLIPGTMAVGMFKGVAEKLKPRIEEVYGPWKESYGHQ